MRTITTADVLNDIEFELMQGAVSKDDLGQGIQAARQYQNKVRAEMMASVTDGELDAADLVGRQFQLNDMLLTLLQVADDHVQALQVKLYKSTYLKQHRPAAATTDRTSAPNIEERTVLELDADEVALDWTPDFSDIGPAGDPELADAMSSDALAVSIDVRPVYVPLLGAVLTRVRTALHSLVHFYVERLARKQADVNQLYGEHIERLEQVNRQQQNQIEVLNRQISALRTKIDS